MPFAFSKYLEQKVHQHFLRTGAAVPQPTSLYLALFDTSGNPDDVAIPANEVSGNGYVRQNVTTLFSQNGINASLAENNAVITFPLATGSWGTIYQWAIMDAATGGNSLFNGTWATAKQILANDQFQVGAVDLTIQFD